MTAYGLRISDWSSDVCSSDLPPRLQHPLGAAFRPERKLADGGDQIGADRHRHFGGGGGRGRADIGGEIAQCRVRLVPHRRDGGNRSEEHTSELQSLMRISYAVFCLKKKKKNKRRLKIESTSYK